MTETYVTIELKHLTCPNCGITYGIPSKLVDELKNDHRLFYCPAGHSQYFPQESDVERLKRQLTIANQDKDRLGEMLTKTERKFRRIKTRVSNGVCPCCNRYFMNVHRHIKNKHPKYK